MKSVFGEVLKSAFVGLFIVLPVLVVGCAVSDHGEKSTFTRTPFGRTLQRLWDAHGGVESWNDLQRARLQFQVQGDPPELEIPPAAIEFRLDDWGQLLLGPEEYQEVVHLDRAAKRYGHEEAVDYHLRTARIFFQLPLSISQPGWELRRELLGDVDTDNTIRGFWAIPREVPSPHVGYFLELDERTDLLKAVYYQVSHPRFSDKIFKAEFRGYQRFGKILIATEVVHRLVKDTNIGEGERPGSARPLDPFEPVRAAFKPALVTAGEPYSVPFLWIQRFNKIRLD